MKRKILYFILIVVLISSINHLSPYSVFAAGVGTTGASFLKIGVGARAVAMGEAFAGVADDASAIYWNPGGLGILSKKEFSAMHLQWFEGIQYEGLTYVHPTERRGTFGVDFRYLHTDALKKTVVNSSSSTGYDELGTFSSYDMMATVGYGKQILPHFNLGVGLKYIKETIDDKDATAIAGDFGLLFDLRGGRIGLSLQNLGTKLKFVKEEGSLPFNIKFGVSSSLLDDKFILGLEINQPNDGKLSMRVGTEIWAHKFFALRGGYKYTIDEDSDLGITSGLTAGIGFGKRSNRDSGLGYQIDYAFVPYGDFGYTHRISLTMTFGESFTKAPEIEEEEFIETDFEIAPEKEPVKEELPQPLDKIEQGVVSVAILDLFRDKSIPLSEARFVNRYLQGELSKSQSLHVIGNADSRRILKRNNLDFGLRKPRRKYLLEAGKILNVDKIIIGEISLKDQKYKLAIGVINIGKKRIEYQDSVVYSLFNIEQAIKELSSELIGAITEK